MLKLTKTGIGLLTKQYRSVLRKCLLLNLGITLFMTSIENSHAVVFQEPFYMGASSWAVNLGYDSNNFGYLSLYKSGGGAVSLNTDGLLVSLLNGRSSFLGADSFRLNGSSSATGIDFATNVTSGTTYASHLTTTGAVNQLLNYYYTKDEVQAQVGKLNLTGVGEDSSYKNTVALGGNYIKPYVDVTLDSSGEKPTWAVSFSVKLTDGNSYAIGTWSGGTLPYKNITEIDNWQPVDANDPNTKYYFGALSGVGSISHPVTQADRDIIVAKAQDLLKDGKLWKLVDYGVKNVSRNDVSVIDNIGILDDVIGTWSNGTHIKEFDYLQTNTANQSSSVVMAYGTIGANLKALDTAIGSWSGGHYIKNSVSSSNPADTTHLTVGQALSALDEQLYNYYYTKTETDSAISSAISGYATQSWVTGKGYLTSVATGNIANEAVTDAKIASGITASKITQTSSYRFVTDAEKSTWNAKQNALSTAQLNAVNSGITAAKVSTYDGYATTIAGKADKATTLSGYGINNAYTKTETDSAISQAISGFVTNDVQSLNYYYTFRVDERDEVIEFAKELRGNKKEMSSLDFMPIKSSSDLRINLIKAEDPLRFSAKTRDDSLVLMEVCHA